MNDSITIASPGKQLVAIDHVHSAKDYAIDIGRWFITTAYRGLVAINVLDLYPYNRPMYVIDTDGHGHRITMPELRVGDMVSIEGIPGIKTVSSRPFLIRARGTKVVLWACTFVAPIESTDDKDIIGGEAL